MSDILALVAMISLPCIVTFILLMLFGPNHCGGSACRRGNDYLSKKN